MRLNKSLHRAVYPPVKFMPLVAALVVPAMLLSSGAPAQAQPVNPDAELDGRTDPAPQQVVPEEDARLGGLNLISNGQVVEPTPAFDPEITRYVATVTGERVSVRAYSPHSDAVIDQITVDGETTVLDPPDNLLDTSVDTAEGAITQFSLRVVAEDGITTRTYHIDFSRPAADTVPDITIEAETTQHVAGLDIMRLTLTREGDTTDSLDVTVSISQDQPWLSETTFTATFAAGDAETDHLIPAAYFSSDVTESGYLVAIVDAVEGYDTSGARALVEVISQEGPAITVTVEPSAYTVDEDAGTLDITLVARAHSSVTQIGQFAVSVQSQTGQAVGANDNDPGDYRPLSAVLLFTPSDFQLDNGSLVARNSVSLTILDDKVYEGDEQFHITLARSPGLSSKVILLDLQGAECVAECPNPFPVTIRDNDPKPHLVLSTTDDQIHEGASGTANATLEVISINGTTYPDKQTITVSFGGGATPGDDYTVAPADQDTVADDHQITLRKRTTSATFTLTAVDDTATDPCEWIIVSATLDADGSGIPSPREIAVVDNEVSLQVPAAALPVGLLGIRTGAITEVGEHDWFCFSATADDPYIIEMKQALTYINVDEHFLGGDARQVPGYLVDPSILEVVDQDNTQVLGEHDRGGFALNFARAFFAPDTTGTYYVRVGAGPQDRGAIGLYTISVRVDDHADDYKTEPGVVLRPGESITSTIDSDVSPGDPGLNPWDWADGPFSVIPRRGIESLDDRDVFRYEITDAGTYRVSVSAQPDGVGIWYIWNELGNLFAESKGDPVSEFVLHHDPGAYYAEVGTPYQSSGNTGDYTVSLASAGSR